MKVRDSGMPEEEMWEGFFDADKILRAFGLDKLTDVAEFGCGYGTFTFPAARMVSGTVYAFDIEADMVGRLEEKCRQGGVSNVAARVRDFVADGTGLADASMDAALLFNILHHDEPVALMREARRIIKPGGILAVIHWNHDPTTPRGPAMEIRPRPEQCAEWGLEAGFSFGEEGKFDFPPYHYGLLFWKPG